MQAVNISNKIRTGACMENESAKINRLVRSLVPNLRDGDLTGEIGGTSLGAGSGILYLRTMTSEGSAKTEPLESLDFPQVLEAISAKASTVYGERNVLALEPGKADSALERDFDRIEELIGGVQRGEPLPFDGVRDLTGVLDRAATQGSHLEPGKLVDLAETISAARGLKKFIISQKDRLSSLDIYAKSLVDLDGLERRIREKIDFRTVELKDNASSELKRIRRAIASNAERSRRRLEALVRRYGADNWLLETGYTMRDDRYVLAVKHPHRGKVRGIVHGQSSSGGTVYIEPDELVEIANELRRLAEEEAVEVRRILIELTDHVRANSSEIEGMLDAVEKLDSLQARAVFADEVGAMRPGIGGEELRLVQARHPLLVIRKGLERTVPLDLALDSGGRVLVITGPNAGGKTVALKTVGLITALIHAGVWPPCGDGTRIPAIFSWHVVIGDEQSLEGDLSSFSGHLSRWRNILDDDSEAMLVLIDEVASGTDPAEGSALAMSLLETAVRRGWWTLVTTHMGALKAFAHSNDGIRNGSMQFDRAALSPTYRFLPDLPGSSYALEIASRVGLPGGLLKRARSKIGEQRQRLEDLIEELSTRLSETERERRELAIGRSEAAGMEKLLRERLDRLESEKSRLSHEAADKAERLLAEANRAVEKAVREIRESQASHAAIKKAHRLVDEQKEAVREVRKRAVPDKKTRVSDIKRDEAEKVDSGPLAPGDTVELENGTLAEVLALQGDKVQVAAGMIKLWLPVEAVSRSREKAAGRGGGVNLHVSAAGGGEPVGSELKLLGMRYEEAEAALEKYLENLALAGLESARIVHGKGAGVLRQLVLEKLESHPLVRTHRLGEHGEGGDGVTIVELKG